ALGLGACARHAEESSYGHAYGSLKDDVAVAHPSPRPAKVAVVPAPPARAAPSAAPAVVVATPPVNPPPASPRTSAVATMSVSSSVTPASAVDQSLPLADDPTAATQMLSEGEALFDVGKVQEARRLFMAAMNGPVPDVLLALARSYDTYHLSRLPSSDA